MKISEIRVGQGNIDVEGTIKEIAEPRVFNKFGRELRVADAILEDDSGTIKLNLWNDDVEKFKAGDKVKISNGYAKEFQGEKQLTSGKFGKIEKVGESEAMSDEGQSELPEVDDNADESPEEAKESEEADLDQIEEDEEDF